MADDLNNNAHAPEANDQPATQVPTPSDKEGVTPTNGDVSADATLDHDPKTYVCHTHAVYVGGKLYQRDEPFTTVDEPGEGWEEMTDAQAAVAIATSKTMHPDPNFGEMDEAALQAYAAERNVPFDGLSKDDLITAIKAADEPSL